MRAIARLTHVRLLLAVVASFLLVVLLAPAPAAADDGDGVTLATEAFEEPPGPEPMGPNESGNPAAPGDWTGPPFARFVAAVLTIAAVGGTLILGGLYLVLVKRPQDRQRSSV